MSGGLLDWSGREHWSDQQHPCVDCGAPTNLRDDDHNPRHKVCAEHTHAAELDTTHRDPHCPRCPATPPTQEPSMPEPSPLLLAAALSYAARGWPVFVLGRTKRPLANCPACRTTTGHDPARCGHPTCHGFYAATTNPDRIRAILNTHPRGLLAIRTGAASGLLVVDIDPHHGGTLLPGLMPPTLAVRTGSDGWHLYYTHPGIHVPSKPLPGYDGIDIKADGGYVVAPPSTHPDTGRPYGWANTRELREMPPALLGACLLQPATPAAPPVATTQAPGPASAGGISSPPALLAAHLDAVRTAPVGKRRTTLYGAARGIARMVAAGAVTADHARAVLTTTGRQVDQTDRDIHAAITAAFHAEGIAA